MDLTEFTIEELFALAAGVGAKPPAFLRGEPFSTWTSELRSEVEAIGRRSLSARGVLTVDDDSVGHTPEVVRTLSEVLGSPEVLVRVSCIADESIRVMGFLVTRDYCATQRLTRLGNFKFALLDSSKTSAALAEILAMEPGSKPPAGGEDIEVSVEQLREAVGAQSGSDDEPIEELLARSGLGADVVSRLTPVLGPSTAGWAVEVFAPSEDFRSFAGSVTAWIDTPSSRWMVAAEPGDNPVVRYRQTTTDQIMASISDGLPDWWTDL